MDDYPYTLNYPSLCGLFWYKNMTMKPTDNLPCHLSMCYKSERTDGLSILNNNKNNDDDNNNSNNKYPLGIMYKDKLNILFIQTDSVCRLPPFF